MSNRQPYAKKSLGQHWLKDPATLEAIVDAAGLQPDDTVLEVGPGPGSLTDQLLANAGQVVAVELDDRFAAALSRRDDARLRVVHQNILEFDLTSLPAGYKVVANIPYYLTSNLLRVLSESPNPPRTIVLLVQKEVAERVAAQPGQMSLLSVSVQLYYRARLGEVVPAALFTPPPKVDSRVLVLERHDQPLFDDPAGLLRVAKAGFAARRKTLLNSLSAGLRVDKPLIEEALREAGLRPGDRAQNLSLADWDGLRQALAVVPRKKTT